MSDQILLPGFEPPAAAPPKRKKEHRLFLAAMPDAEVAATVGAFTSRLLDEHGIRARPFPEWRLHLSLHFIDDFATVPPSLIYSLDRAFGAVRAPQFEIAFDRVQSFAGRYQRPDHYPLVLTCSRKPEALLELFSDAGAALRRLGFKTALPVEAFEPHMTLAYDSRIVPERAVPEIRWTVRELVLVHNLLKSGQPYSLLRRWPLRA